MNKLQTQLTTDINELSKQKSNMRSEISELTSQVANIKSNVLPKLTTQVDEKSNELRNLSSKVREHKVSLARLEKERNQVSTDVTKKTKELEDIKLQMKQKLISTKDEINKILVNRRQEFDKGCQDTLNEIEMNYANAKATLAKADADSICLIEKTNQQVSELLATTNEQCKAKVTEADTYYKTQIELGNQNYAKMVEKARMKYAKELDASMTRLSELNTQVEDKTKHLDELNEKHAELIDAVVNLEQMLDEKQSELDRLTTSITVKTSKLEALSKDLKKVESTLDKSEVANLQTQIKELQATINELEEKLHLDSEKLEQLPHLLEQETLLSAQIAKLADERDSYKEKCDKLTQEVTDLEVRLELKEQELINITVENPLQNAPTLENPHFEVSRYSTSDDSQLEVIEPTTSQLELEKLCQDLKDKIKELEAEVVMQKTAKEEAEYDLLQIDPNLESDLKKAKLTIAKLEKQVATLPELEKQITELKVANAEIKSLEIEVNKRVPLETYQSVKSDLTACKRQLAELEQNESGRTQFKQLTDLVESHYASLRNSVDISSGLDMKTVILNTASLALGISLLFIESKILSSLCVASLCVLMCLSIFSSFKSYSASKEMTELPYEDELFSNRE